MSKILDVYSKKMYNINICLYKGVIVMKLKKVMACFLTTALTSTCIGTLNITAEMGSNLVISRNCPAYSQANPATASAGNDAFYYSFWSGTAEDYLAYDLSDVPTEQRKKVLAVWYNATGQYDYTVVNQNSNGMPTDYTIEVNSAEGGAYPETGWEVVETVSGNTLHSRQHVVDMEGYNWIRMNVKKADNKDGGSVQLNFDIHNVSEGIEDSWIFFGDSITAGGMMNCYGTGFAEYVNQLDSNYYPAQENGGIGGIFSTDGRNNIEKWLSTFPGKYVSIAYGTNDAWGNQTGADKYYENTAFMVEKVIEAGKTPIVPKIPYSTESGVNTYLDSYNEMVDKIYTEYPQVVKGPDFDVYFRENPDLLSSDGVHPSSEGYDGMRKLWAETMYENVYMSNAPEGDIAEVGDLNCDGHIDSDDVKIMSDYLTGKSIGMFSTEYQQDVCKDGKINTFDLIALKRMTSVGEETGELTETTWEATDSNVKIVGRNVTKNDATWLCQSGSSAEFTITGQDAEIVIAGNEWVNESVNYRPRYAIYIDDELLTDETMDSVKETHTLFTGSNGTHKVKVILLSEAMYGPVGIGCINVTSTSAKPVKPTPKSDLNIEFIGDSITCAYGVEASGSGESFKTTTENFTKSYAYLTAQKLGADYSAVSYSGHGIISGFTNTTEKNTDSIIPDCYELATKYNGFSENWTFDKTKNDAVVINLGTNDSSYITAESNANREERAAEFIEGYVDFLKTVRNNNTNAYIICTLGTMDFENIYEYVSDAVDAYKAETGDEKIMFYQSVMHTQADGYGADWHPSEKTQQNSAYVLADKICQALGMESDQIGLDVAGDATYDVEVDSASGANAAHYVGYDKSFWINTVTGGSDADDIKAVLSGIGIKEDGKYRLEFDYTAGAAYDMQIMVNGDLGAEIFSDSVMAGSEKLHYSMEFESDKTAENGAIEFWVGGHNSCNTTLSNIKLTKIG